VLELPPIYYVVDQHLFRDNPLYTESSDHPIFLTGAAGSPRRESEIDDHGEAYPAAWQGPGLYVLLHVPPGSFVLSLYFFNKDGHTGSNRHRDYLLSLIPLSESYPSYQHGEVNVAPLARSRGVGTKRVVNFWGGVWERYWIHGPVKLAIHVSRNYSLNAILNGAFLDPLAQHPEPYYYGPKAWRLRLEQLSEYRLALRQRWPRIVGTLPKVGGAVPASYFAHRILRDEEFLLHEDPNTWAGSDQLVYTSLLRWYSVRFGQRMFDANELVLTSVARIDYRLGLFSGWEGIEGRLGILTARRIEDGIKWNGLNLNYRGFEYGVIRRYVERLKRPPSPGMGVVNN
jgi:hypothetical protein